MTKKTEKTAAEQTTVPDDMLFHYIAMQRRTYPVNQLTNRIHIDRYELRIAKRGHALLLANESIVVLEPGQPVLLCPGMIVSVQTGEAELECDEIAFQVLHKQETAGGVAFQPGEWPAWACLHASAAPCDEIGRLSERLYACTQTKQERETFKHYALFYQLIHVLMERAENAVQASGNRDGSAIERTIAYMEQHFAETITRDKLARIAGVSPWHFSHLFKKTTGQTPSDFLTALRLKQAKEELVVSKATLKEIVQQVGFRDEAHFRRKFKEEAGLSPMIYRKQKREKIAVLSYSYASHLLALDIVPYATLVDRQRERHRAHFHNSIPVHLLRAKTMDRHMWQANLDRLAEAAPDMIVCDEELDRRLGASLRALAPTVAIPWLDTDWRGHFRQIGELVDKGKQAERWLAAYERKAAHARTTIKGKLGTATVSLLHIMQGELLVYGCRNGGTIYDDLQLASPYERSGIEVYKVIALAELPHYDADIMLVAIDRDPASVEKWSMVKDSGTWRSLQAVRTGMIHYIEETPWLEYTPYAHSLVLEEAAQLFAEGGRKRGVH